MDKLKETNSVNIIYPYDRCIQSYGVFIHNIDDNIIYMISNYSTISEANIIKKKHNRKSRKIF